MSWITGVGLLPFGRHEGKNTLDLMSEAAALALNDAGLKRGDIDGVLTGYATTMPHIMLATVFCEHFGLSPAYAHGLQVGGATGFAMAMLAHELVAAGRLEHVLVVAGENRLSAPGGRDKIVETLAQVGHPVHEVPLGPTIPAYYGLVANRYMHEHDVSEADLAELAVLMRTNAMTHPGAQFRAPITVDDVLASKPIARPLKLLDCCATADGAVAFVVSRERTGAAAVRIIGAGQAHTHQHISEAPSLTEFGARLSMDRAIAATGRKLTTTDADYLAIYDSFTITLAILLEELGLARRGEACGLARDGYFSRTGTQPLPTHGGLMSYGHCGVAGALAHLVETQLQMTGRAERRQVADAGLAFLHGDGGVMSSHVSLIMERQG
ncbi:MAG: thiolase [Hyphomicrobium sp. SCN 65-11]|nr:MAG: thiolase [Hyphomicrobium sp. SCN 65-11]